MLNLMAEQQVYDDRPPVNYHGQWLVPDYTPWTPCEGVDHAGAEINP